MKPLSGLAIECPRCDELFWSRPVELHGTFPCPHCRAVLMHDRPAHPAIMQTRAEWLFAEDGALD